MEAKESEVITPDCGNTIIWSRFVGFSELKERIINHQDPITKQLPIINDQSLMIEN